MDVIIRATPAKAEGEGPQDWWNPQMAEAVGKKVMRID